jgi:hypothetical protein
MPYEAICTRRTFTTYPADHRLDDLLYELRRTGENVINDANAGPFISSLDVRGFFSRLRNFCRALQALRYYVAVFRESPGKAYNYRMWE